MSRESESRGEVAVQLAEIDDWLERKAHATKLRKRALLLLVVPAMIAVVLAMMGDPQSIGLGALVLLIWLLVWRAGRRSDRDMAALEAERSALLSGSDNAALPRGPQAPRISVHESQ